MRLTTRIQRLLPGPIYTWGKDDEFRRKDRGLRQLGYRRIKVEKKSCPKAYKAEVPIVHGLAFEKTRRTIDGTLTQTTHLYTGPTGQRRIIETEYSSPVGPRIYRAELKFVSPAPSQQRTHAP